MLMVRIRANMIKFKVVKTAFDSRLENLAYKPQTTNVRRRLVKAVSLNDWHRNYL